MAWHCAHSRTASVRPRFSAALKAMASQLVINRLNSTNGASNFFGLSIMVNHPRDLQSILYYYVKIQL